MPDSPKSATAIGVCAIIIPWNAPMVLTVNKIAPALAAGCTCIVKPQVEDATLLGRFGFPADIAEVVHALAAPSMGWVTGQLIEASGGFSV